MNPVIGTMFANSKELNFLESFRKKVFISSQSQKADVTKFLLVPMIHVLAISKEFNNSVISEVWDTIQQFREVGNLEVASIISCSIVEFLSHDTSPNAVTLPNIWDLIFELFNDSVLVHRKRAAHVLQIYSIYISRDSRFQDALSWCQSFLEVYRQLEGCTTVHLVSQVHLWLCEVTFF